MRHWLTWWMLFLLAGCGGSLPREARIAHHDWGDPFPRWPENPIVIRQVEVQAAPWLASPGQLYRLTYIAPQRRQSYAESRWVAPPAELLEHWLARIILPGQPAGNVQSGCRLVIWLDELEQRFASASFSEVVLAARAQLLQGHRVLAQENLQIVRPAMTPDSAGGVQATREAARALTEALAGWLIERRQRDPLLAQICSRG